MRQLLRRIFRYGLIFTAVCALAPAVVLLVLRFINPPSSAFITRTTLHLRTTGSSAEVAHEWVSLDRIAHCMPLAVVAGEDQTFPTNHGFDWSAIARAIRHNAQGKVVHGASTITEQTAKNLFLWPARSYVRKAIGAYITIWMNLVWPKRRIMAVYLNIIQLSDTAFGVQAAARQLFHTDAAHLSRRQCAALAAVLPAPDKYHAAHPGRYIAGRRAWILRQMRHLGSHYLDDALDKG